MLLNYLLRRNLEDPQLPTPRDRLDLPRILEDEPILAEEERAWVIPHAINHVHNAYDRTSWNPAYPAGKG